MLRVTVTFLREDRADYVFEVDHTEILKLMGHGLYITGGGEIVHAHDGQRLFRDGDEVAMVTFDVVGRDEPRQPGRNKEVNKEGA